MLGDTAIAHAKHEHVIRRRPAHIGELDEMPAGSLHQRLRSRGAAPVLRIGRHRLGLGSIKLAPGPCDQPKAVGAHTLQARLMVIGRAEPAARRLNDSFALGHRRAMS